MRALRPVFAVAVIGCCLQLACQAVERPAVTPDWDADRYMAFFALTGRTAAGVTVAGSGLFASPERAIAAGIDRELSTIRLLAWTRADLIRIAGDRAELVEQRELLERTPLEGVSDCEPALPPPARAATLVGDRFVDTATDAGDRVTAAWLEGVCPGPEGLAIEDLSVRQECACETPGCCALRVCTSRVRRGAGCSVEIAFPDCSSAGARAAIGPDRSFCFSRSAENECTGVAPRHGDAAAAAECARDGLLIELFDTPAPYVERRAQIRPEPPDLSAIDLGLEHAAGLRVMNLRRGLLADFAILEDRVVVAARRGGLSNEVCGRRDAGTDLVFISLGEDATKMGETPGPECLSRLLADPETGTFLGAFDLGDARAIGRFTRDGELMAATTSSIGLPRPDPQDGPRTDWVLDLVRTSSPAVLGLFFGSTHGDLALDRQSWIATFDPPTLEHRGTRWFSGQSRPVARLLGVAADGDGATVLATEDEDNTIWRIDLSTLTPTSMIPIARATSPELGAIALHERTGLAAVARMGATPSLVLLDDVQEIGSYEVHESLAVPTAIGPWPPDPDLLMVAFAVSIGRDIESRLALFEPREGRYRPGLRKIGRGVVSKIQADHRGRVWLLLPWTGELVRLDPR